MLNRTVWIVLGLIAALAMAGCTSDEPVAPVIPSPRADFRWSGADIAPAMIQFRNLSQNADRFYWQFGDGRSSDLKEPVVRFDLYGDYQVELNASQSETGRASILTKTLRIEPSQASLDSIIVLRFPTQSPISTDWDAADGPDLFVTLTNPDGSLIATTEGAQYYNLTPPNLPVGWAIAPPRGVTLGSNGSWGGFFKVEAWDLDEDGIVVQRELMGAALFDLDSLAVSSGFSESYTLQSGAFWVRIGLKWQ